MSIDGEEAEIDRLNGRFFATILVDAIMYGALSDLEVFQLKKRRYFALATAWAKKDEDRYFSLLFPEGDFGPRRVADVPILGGLAKAQNFFNGFDTLLSKISGDTNDERALQEATEQALLCDEAAGDSKCMDEFVEEYHEVLKSLWRDLNFFLDFFTYQFPSVPCNAPLNPTKLDTIKERLWGEQCRTMCLDLMKDGECHEGWMHQEESGSFDYAEHDIEEGSLELWAEVIYGWYHCPMFEYEKIKTAHQESRKESVKRFVGLLLEKELSKAKLAVWEPRDSKKKKKKKKKTERPIDDVRIWSAAAGRLYTELFPKIASNIYFRNRNLEESSNGAEALSLALDVLLKHPSVRTLDEKVRKSVLRQACIKRNENDMVQRRDPLDIAKMLGFDLLD